MQNPYKSVPVLPSEITPRSLYENRRDFLKAAGLLTAGAVLASWFLTPLFGVGTINQNNFSLPALLVSLLGAIILLAIVKLVRRAR